MRTLMSKSKGKYISFGAVILLAITYFAQQDHANNEEDAKSRQTEKSVLTAIELKAALESLDIDPTVNESKKASKVSKNEDSDGKGKTNKICQREKEENESCGCHHGELRRSIFEFYTRNTWWDAKLCKENSRLTGSNVTDLIPLKTLNKDAWPDKDQHKNIYFIENNCKPSIQVYVLCSLESAAKMNPDAMIFLLTVIPFLEDKSKAIRTLLTQFTNIQILQADYDNILLGTPLDGFRNEEVWTKNDGFLKPHMSDITRIALVWKEGGTYMDSDIITIKKHPLVNNALMHGESDISNGYIRTNKHHAFLEGVMNYQKDNYDGNSYSNIGPRSTTVGVNLYCNMTTYTAGMCKDVTILPMKSFTPLNWDEADKAITPNSTINLSELLESSYGIHTSHHMLKEKLNSVQTDSIYDKLTKEFCPLSHSHMTHLM